VDGHLSPGRVAELARNTRPGLVVLTHMYPLVASQHPQRTVTDRAGTDCVAARDGDVFAIPHETETSS
jgi:ribonuclease BN (tRNA processing enzyme)